MKIYKKVAKVFGLGAVLLSALVMISCGGSSGSGSEPPRDGEDERLTPCVVYVEEPVLHIDEVFSSAAGTNLSSVLVSDVNVDDKPFDLKAFCFDQPHAEEAACSGLRLGEDDALICDMSCSFGREEGSWTFQLAAEGHTPQTFTLDAEYEIDESDGCTRIFDQGTRYNLELDAVTES